MGMYLSERARRIYYRRSPFMQSGLIKFATLVCLVSMRRKLGSDMNFRRLLPEIRCLTTVCPTEYALLLAFPQNGQAPFENPLT
jgi:hypothetical protein